MLTLEDGAALMQSRAQETHDGASWSGLCAAFVYRFTGSHIAYPTAADAYRHSRIIGLVADEATTGAIHFWTDRNGTGPGHTAIAMGGSSGAMASNWVPGNGVRWGVCTGVVNINHYTATHPGLQYQGWAPAYGANPMMQDLIIAVRQPSSAKIWRINEIERDHLTPVQWARLFRRGVRAKHTTTALLGQFTIRTP